MHKQIIYFATGLIIVSSMFAGCAKKEETKGEKAVLAGPKKRPTPSTKLITEERVLFSFENNAGGWEIPDWVLEKDDHVAESIEISKDVADEGNASLKINCDFPGGKWTAGLIELEQFLDFGPYREIAVDVYIPKTAPMGLTGKIILTVGERWKFTEMTRAIPLIPGEWVTIRANIEPGSYDWKRIVPDESFRMDVRKVAVRIESNKQPIYKGPVYIDSVRICK